MFVLFTDIPQQNICVCRRRLKIILFLRLKMEGRIKMFYTCTLFSIHSKFNAEQNALDN